MKKIGIITLYYDSQNYGGLLQSYALTYYINNKLGYLAEQICYKPDTIRLGFDIKKRQRKLSKLLNPNCYLKKMEGVILNFYNKFFLSKKLRLRYSSCKTFERSIPHSKLIYDYCNIQECQQQYDMFIVGSDQVWNMNWFDKNLFLDFVSDNKTKIAYGVSLGNGLFNNKQKEYLRTVLPCFAAVSVREKNMVEVLQPLYKNSKISWVLDPTMLLDKKDWDNISSKRIIEGNYLFCYFLGNGKRIRILAKKYAKRHNLQIVSLPHLSAVIKYDIGFGDYKLYNITPNDFISLIKYSERVFTDSFHASVFSILYNKTFFVSNRLGIDVMSDRIYSLCELFGCGSHFLDADDKLNIKYIESVNQLESNYCFSKFNEIKKKSIDFLEQNLSR